MTDIHKKLLADFEAKALLEQAQQYAFDYLDTVTKRSVFPSESDLQGLQQFVEPVPEKPTDGSEVLEQLNTAGAPATVAQIGGRYFGFVNGSVVPSAMAARWLSDVWDQNSALYVISPLAATLEEVCERWVADLLGLPDDTVAGFVSGSSMAILCGLAAGRYHLFAKQGWDINKQGFVGAPPIRVITGKQAHGTVVKAVALLGLGIDTIEWVETDDQGRINVDAVPDLDDKTLLILQAGNVSTGSFDSFDPLCKRAREAGAWVHIDGAFGLWAGAASGLKHLTAGMEYAHSFSVDGHKTLNTPYDNGLVLCRDKQALQHALHASGSYIVRSEHRDGMFYTPEMSRRARSVELWATLKTLGRSGVDALITGLHQRAQQMAEGLGEQSFEILNDVVFNQVLLRCESDKLTEATMHAIQRSGECWVGGAQWQGKPAIRVSICSWMTSVDDINRSVAAFVKAREVAKTAI